MVNLKSVGGMDLRIGVKYLTRFSSDPAGYPAYISGTALFPSVTLYPDTTVYPAA